MKKKILISLLGLLCLFILYQVYIFTFEEEDNINPIYLIPEDAVYVIDTKRPLDTWDEISNSDIWKHLQTNTTVKDISESAVEFDAIFQSEKKLFDFIGEREIVVSAHVHRTKNYEFLYVIDLGKLSKIKLLKSNISKLVGKNYRVTKRIYKNNEITELYNSKERNTVYITFIKNQLVASFTHILVEKSIDEYENPTIGRDLNFIEIDEEVENDGFLKLYIQHKYLEKYIFCFTDNQISNVFSEINNAIFYSGFDVTLKEGALLMAEGSTNVNNSSNNILKALQKSGKSSLTIDEIAPITTATYFNFSFDNFSDFKKNFNAFTSENFKDFENYQKQLNDIEKKLDINFEENFYSWIGDEIGVLHLNSIINTNKKDNLVLAIKANDIENANKNINYILGKIRQKTPLKFKQITYKNNAIHFLDLKGFFKLFVSNMFQEIEKPYVTIVDDFVLFSNSPNSLKEVITSFQLKQTLNNSQDFVDFKNQFYEKSNLFAYTNTGHSFESIQNFTEKSSQNELIKNKDFIICFPHIGYQLSAENNVFKSYVSILYEDPKIVNKNTLDIISKIKNGIKDSSSTIKRFTEETFYIVPEIFPKDLSAPTYKELHDNNNVKFEVAFKNGLKHGKYKEYYKNGVLKVSGSYKKGKQKGAWKGYDEEGKQIFKKRF